MRIVNGTCPFPRGKAVGGTTISNGLAYVRGHPIDFDRWSDMGNPGWSYEDVLPYFKKSEDFHRNNPLAPVDFNYHGTGGYLSVEYHLPPSRYLAAFLNANQELGYKLTDYNSPEQIGASPVQQNTKHGRRADGGSAFILPILNRTNLKVMTDSFVIKLHINEDTKKVAGVYFSYKGKIHIAKPRKEVIISAGAISSPQLLLLSGIGPKDHLNEMQIPVIQNLEVGSTLRDHSQYYGLTFASNISLPSQPLSNYIEEYLKGVGPFTISGPNDGIGFYQTSFEKTANYPDLELVIISPNATSTFFKDTFGWNDDTYDATWGGIDVSSSFSIYIINLHQLSVGSVKLKSNSPYDYPLIDANFLSDPNNRDIQVLYEGIQFVLKLTATDAFKTIGAKFQAKPLPACKEFEAFSKDYWYCSLRQLTFDVYHPVGTCPMGPDSNSGAVVDNKLKVYGITNLRVADSSVFPFTLSGHPNAPCVMIGEKVSDLIKEQYNRL
ncbi:hypothetical protein NQ314_007556 [Rhamnusium bicolor]|uniref:Glucose-methanol-choline oxidoreductase N-terminal domain-containing protein n=1 Tax=Rhamnusium bicolor TaxID=1586634 RepID=A0AAV8YL39_9CUCU|nr:hypothetical protein NQ314_007556 [Rhamnusium bicolor]